MSGKGPDLKRYMEKRLLIKVRPLASFETESARARGRPRRAAQLVGKRQLTGTLRGYDQFMNLVVDDAIELVSKTENNPIGTIVIRGAPRSASKAAFSRVTSERLAGNSVENFELMEREAQIDRCTGNVIG